MLQLPIKTFSSNHAAGIAKAEQELFAIHGTRSTLAVPMLIALNTFNRNVYMETPELLVDTTAGKLDLGLNFNSCSPTDQHWRCNFLSELRLVTGSPHNHYVFTDPSGSEVIYSYNSTSGHYIAPKDSDNPQSYIEVTATGADWYDPHSNQRKRFESSGALLRQSAIIAANGQSLCFNYVAGKDWFESIYDPQADCYYRVNFSGNSVNISHEKTTLGRTTTNLLVQYNFNRLFERLESIKSYSTDMSIGRTTSSYDTNIEYSTNPTGHIYTITQSDGVIYHLDCNHSGQLKYIYLTDEKRPYYRVKQQDNKTLVYTRPFEDTSVLKRLFGGVVKENHQGICFSHTADGRYEQITNEMPDHMLEDGDTIEREYVTSPTAKTFDWTADKQLKTVFHADLSKTQYEYHASGALKSETVLDKNLDVVSKTEFSYNTFGAVIELKQTVNTTTVETTHFYYDETLEADSGCRRLLYKVLPGGRVEEYLYDDKGMQTTTKQFTNTLSYVPTQAQLTALSTWCANETASVNFIIVQRTFNDYGQAESRSGIDEETFTYGLAGEVLTHLKHNSSAKSITESFSFDASKRLSRQTDFLERLSIHTYAKNQQTLSHHNGLEVVKNFNSSAQITASQTTGGQDSKTPKVQKIYNDAGQVIAELSSNGQKRINLYDSAGDLRFSVDQSGVLTELNYSPANGSHEAIIYGKKLDLTTVKFSDLIDTTTGDSPTISASDYQKLCSHILTSSATLSTSADRYHQEVMHANGQIEFEIKRQDDNSYSVVHHQYDAKGRETLVTAYASTLTKDQVKLLATSHQWDIAFLDATNDRVTQRTYQNGALAFEIDPRGVTTAFVYDGAGQEIARYSGNIDISDAKFQTAKPSLYDDASVITTLKYYNKKGLVYRQVDAEGYVTDFDYYANGELKQSRRYLATIENLSGLSYEQIAGEEIASSDEDKVIQYQYDDLGRCCTESHLNDNYDISREWDDHDNLIKEIKRDSASEKLCGDTYRETQTRYDDLNRVLASINPSLASYVRNFKYDDALTEEQKAKKRQELLNTYALHTTYTSQGLVATTEKQNGGMSYYLYDDANQLICEMDKCGQATQYQYDAFGNVLIKSIAKIVDATKVTKLLEKADDHHIAEADLSDIFKSAHQTKYEYYSSGLLKSVTDPQGFSKSYEYNAFGETKTEQQQITKAITADEEEKVEQEDELPAQPATYLIHRYEYDTAGNKTKIIQANSIDTQVIKTTHEYNHPLNLCTASQTDDGEKALTEFDRLGRKVASKIETRDLTTKVRSTETLSTIEKYDAFDRIISERDYSDAATYSETTHSYQRKARKETITTGTNVTSVIHNAFGEKVKSYIGEQEQQRWQHNALGLIFAQYKRTNDVLLQTDVWTYYMDGTLSQHSLYDRRCFYIKKYKYDYGWQVSEIKHSSQITTGQEPKITELGSETFSYDCHKAVKSHTSLAGNTTKFERDGSARVICKTVDPDGLNIKTKSSYNGLGQTLMESVGDSKEPEKYQQQFTYDVFCRKDGSILDPGGINIHTSTKLNKRGLVIKEINGEGHATHFVLDERGNKIYPSHQVGLSINLNTIYKTE